MPKKPDGPTGQSAALGSAVNEHLANERTHLAFLRTAVALITFGITVNRFSLFLIINDKLAPGSGPFIPLFGVEQVGFSVVIVGALLIVWAAVRYQQVSRQIDRGEYRSNPRMVWIVTAAVLVFGVASLFWLFQR